MKLELVKISDRSVKALWCYRSEINPAEKEIQKKRKNFDKHTKTRNALIKHQIHNRKAYFRHAHYKCANKSLPNFTNIINYYELLPALLNAD